MFEFDRAKSIANAAKHGIDFGTAQALWLDQNRIETRGASHGYEERSRVIGLIDGKVWTAIITYRSGQVRIISVRRARANEADAYYS